MDDMAVSPAAPPDLPPAVDDSAPAGAADAPAAAAPDASAASTVDDPNVLASKGRSDFTAAADRPKVDLTGGMPTGALPVTSLPTGATFSATATRSTEAEDAGTGVKTKLSNATAVTASNTERARAGDDGPVVTRQNQVTVGNTTTGEVSASDGTVTASHSVSAGVSQDRTASAPANAQGGVDPKFPEQMAVGGKVTFTTTASTGASDGLSASVPVGGPVAVGAGVTGTQTLSNARTTSVERLDENTMRVTTGSTRAMADELALNANLKVGTVAQVGVTLSGEKGNSASHVDFRDFDLRNPEARAAYDRYIADQSRLPDADPAKGIGAGRTDTFSSTQDNRAALDARLGPLSAKASMPLSNADGTVRVTTNPDGTTTLGHSFTFNNQAMTMTRTFGTDGAEDVGKRRYDMVVSNADPNTAGRIAMGASNSAAFENAVQRRGTQDVQLRFSQDDVDRLRVQAAAHPYSQDRNSFIGRLAAADNPGKLFNTFTDSRSGAVGQLGQLANRTGQAIPGQAWFLDRNSGQTWRFDQPVTRSNGRPLW